METALVNTLLKYVLPGVGGPGVVILFVIFILHQRSKKNAKDIEEIKPRCEEHAESLQKHEVILTKISTNQENMIENQKVMFGKIDRLADNYIKSSQK